MKTAILEFKDEYHFLSNFYICKFTWDGITWPHSESAYQAAKTLNANKRLEFINITPGLAKRKGRQLVIRPDWEDVKLVIMAEILYHKFEQNPLLKEKLIATGSAKLEEGNTWNDRYWGVSPPKSGNGKNHLGRLLEELRELYTG